MSKRYYISIILGCIGLCLGIIFSFTHGKIETMTGRHISVPPPPPFVNNIAGQGVVEASSHNIKVAGYSAGVIHKLYVTEGDQVYKGQPLLALDDKIALANLTISEQTLLSSKAELEVAKITYGHL